MSKESSLLLTLLLAAAQVCATSHPTPREAGTFRDCATCDLMRVIPPGQFLMG